MLIENFISLIIGLLLGNIFYDYLNEYNIIYIN